MNAFMKFSETGSQECALYKIAIYLENKSIDIKELDRPIIIKDPCEKNNTEMFCDIIDKFLDSIDKKINKMDNLTDEEKEIYKAKIDACRSALDKIKNGEQLTNAEKGNLGEMLMDLNYLNQGYKRINGPGVTSLEQKGQHGIDGVYENQNGVPRYIIADAKYGSSQLSDTEDGKQMSSNWIDSRLDDAVGKEKADEIRMEMLLNPENVKSEVVNIDNKGVISTTVIDEYGNKKKEEKEDAN